MPGGHAREFGKSYKRPAGPDLLSQSYQHAQTLVPSSFLSNAISFVQWFNSFFTLPSLWLGTQELLRSGDMNRKKWKGQRKREVACTHQTVFWIARLMNKPRSSNNELFKGYWNSPRCSEAAKVCSDPILKYRNQWCALFHRDITFGPTNAKLNVTYTDTNY